MHGTDVLETPAPAAALPAALPGGGHTPMAFRLEHLRKGEADPRGRIVRDILWAVDEFKIYKTDQGISPFFSDNPESARAQKLAYLGLGPEIAGFNHLIHVMTPPLVAFAASRLPAARNRAQSLVQYERELARCIAQALLGQGDTARESLGSLRARLAAQIANRGRVVHLLVNIILVAMAVAGSLVFAKSGYQSTFGFDVKEMGLAVMMGSIGALFSTTVRLQSMEVDPTITLYMHWVYASQRVLVGALGALVIYFGFKSGVISGLFDGPGAAPQAGAQYDVYWLSFVCVIAGFSERLVPNLLDSKARGGDAAAGAGD